MNKFEQANKFIKTLKTNYYVYFWGSIAVCSGIVVTSISLLIKSLFWKEDTKIINKADSNKESLNPQNIPTQRQLSSDIEFPDLEKIREMDDVDKIKALIDAISYGNEEILNKLNAELNLLKTSLKDQTINWEIKSHLLSAIKLAANSNDIDSFNRLKTLGWEWSDFESFNYNEIAQDILEGKISAEFMTIKDIIIFDSDPFMLYYSGKFLFAKNILKLKTYHEIILEFSEEEQEKYSTTLNKIEEHIRQEESGSRISDSYEDFTLINAGEIDFLNGQSMSDTQDDSA